MSYFTHSGYGYSKRLCEDVTFWFLNKFFPRHKIDLEIVHRGLNREGVHGYCDVTGDTYRPREFLIELNTHMNEKLYIQTLFHELTHLQQWVEGRLQLRYGKMCYNKKCVEDISYWVKPHEIEARTQEKVLYFEYLESKGIVPDRKVVQYFPNRLMQAV
jgi:hypothetical protein